MINKGLLKALNILMTNETLKNEPLTWPWPGHASVAEVVYNKLSEDKQNLDLNKMKDGSNDPDEKFKDMRKHSYPKSYERATYWLNEGKKQYDQKEYGDASYSFGVATHYISDTFSAPHCVSKESGKDHHNFEIITEDLTPEIIYIEGDLETMMKNGVELGKNDWKKWKTTQDRSIVQEEVNRGASAAYTAIKNILS